MNGMKLYGEIAKVEEQDDGTIKVFGYASSEAVDSDGEVIKADAMDAAIAEYMKFPAVREMHQPLAAGTGIVMKVEEDGRTWFGAHVVDPVAVKKVINKVYRGFSIGARVTARDEVNKSVITGIKLKEVSLVDRPANPEATIELWKSEDLTDPEDAVDALAKLLDTNAIDPASLLKLAKAHIEAPADDVPPAPEVTPEPAPEATKADTATDIRKGLYEVARFVELVQAVHYLQQSAEWEAEHEGDNSPIPAKLKACVVSLSDCLKEMLGEELDEMLAMKKADTDADIAKAGARYSKATKGALAGVHKMIRECDKALADMGYESAEEDDGEKADTAADIAKAAAIVDPLKDELAKAAATIEGFGSQLKALVTKVEKLEAEPAPAKGRLLSVEKSAEVALNEGGAADSVKFDLVKKSDGSVDQTASAIKLIHRIGGRPLDPFQSGAL